MARLVLVDADEDILRESRAHGHEPVAAVGVALPGLPFFTNLAAALAAAPEAALLCSPEPPLRAARDQECAGLGLPIADLAPPLSLGTHAAPGLVMRPQSRLTCDGALGRSVLLEPGAVVMHDATIGDYVTIGPRSVVLGRVSIGAGSRLGANVTVLPERSIGRGCVVYAGSVVARDLPDGIVAAGAPARDPAEVRP